MTLQLKFKKLDDRAIIPTKAKEGDLGWDLYTIDEIVIHTGNNILVKTGIACQFPVGYGAIIKDRSGVSTKSRIYVHAGVIDNGYIGEICILLDYPMIQQKGHGTIVGTMTISPGTKIAQMILIPVIEAEAVEVDTLVETDRGTNGFGSSDDLTV